MSEIRIIGTAHVSQKSVDEVRAAIEEFQPDVVAIELDNGRYLGLKEQIRNPEIHEILESKNYNQILIQWILAYIQRKIGMDVGVEPGSEMKAAISETEERGIKLALIDRDIRVTLHRFWHSMSVAEKLKMFYALAGSVFLSRNSGEYIDIEKVTGEDFVEMAMSEFHKISPRGAYALITERDAFMSYQLIHLAQQNERVLAVVGAGHRKGIGEFLTDPSHLPPFGDLTSPIRSRSWGKIFGILVLFFFVLLITLIIFSGVGWDLLGAALLYWVLINGLMTFMFTLLAGGHPVSGIVGFIVSPVSALYPVITAGWFSALMEARIRKPLPSDLKKIIDAKSFSEMRKVPLFKVVLVAVLANIGSILGTIIYFLFIFPILHIDPGMLIISGYSNIINEITRII